MSSHRQTVAILTAARALGERERERVTAAHPDYRCPTCGASLVCVQVARRLVPRRGGGTRYSRPELWNCPHRAQADHPTWLAHPGSGWFAYAPEIQPTGTLRAQFGEDVDDVPF